MFWTRYLGLIPPGVKLKDKRCKKYIDNVLKLFKVGSLVVGHTPQSFQYTEDINSTCSGKVWRVDNGSSSAFDIFDNELLSTGNKATSRRVQYLLIKNDNEYYVCDKNGCKKVKKI